MFARAPVLVPAHKTIHAYAHTHTCTPARTHPRAHTHVGTRAASYCGLTKAWFNFTLFNNLAEAAELRAQLTEAKAAMAAQAATIEELQDCVYTLQDEGRHVVSVHAIPASDTPRSVSSNDDSSSTDRQGASEFKTFARSSGSGAPGTPQTPSLCRPPGDALFSPAGQVRQATRTHAALIRMLCPATYSVATAQRSNRTA